MIKAIATGSGPGWHLVRLLAWYITSSRPLHVGATQLPPWWFHPTGPTHAAGTTA